MSTSPYVDGFVAAVPKVKKQAYAQHARLAGQAFLDHGALSFQENWADDVKPGEKTDMLQAVHCQEDEAVVFSWIVWPSKAHRDEAMPKVMADPRASAELNPMPFDASRLIHGGFVPLVSLTKAQDD